MNKKLLILVLIVIFVVLAVVYFTTEVDEIDDLAGAREVAQSWIENSAPTYVYDGYDLELLSEQEMEDAFEFLFAFETRAGGYGDRTDEMVIQVITPREILVRVEKGEVVKAITDEVYDEIEGEFIEVETTLIDLYFVEVVDGMEEIVSIEREIEKREDIATATLEELLKGIEEENYSSAIPEGVTLQSLVIEDGVAKADFSSELDEVAGSATVIAVREQIEKTLLQFETIEEVVISVDMRTEDILQP